jgi:hypothetical protein
VRRVFLALVVIGVPVALVPPFFTHGACTAEFASVTDSYQGLRPELATLSQAQHYFESRSMRYQLLSAERREHWPTREVVLCPGGPVMLVGIPVQNRICRYYRDAHIRLQLGFIPRQQLVAIQTDMHPFQMMELPALGLEVDWAR